jgi:sialate O-acetylesterase
MHRFLFTERTPMRTFTLLLLLLAAVPAAADVTVGSPFSDNMVLQQGMPVPVWGGAEAGEKVTVTFGKQSHEAVADDKGAWRVTLAPLTASAEPATLTIKGKNALELKNVLVGEVWLCSGQSNMEWPLTASENGKAVAQQADHGQIRLFNVPKHILSDTPKPRCPGSWTACSPKTAGGFSAVGYYFGRRLHEALKVPVGLVGANWGGTKIEPWMPPEGFAAVPELKDFKMPPGGRRGTPRAPSSIYNGMVHPLAPFALRGVIWYQGESNAGDGDQVALYRNKKQGLVRGWRKVFNNDDLAFYWVQLANFKGGSGKPAGGDPWALIQEQQLKALDIPHTGMAVIIDIGNEKDIHPRNKKDVGDRLSRWALHQAYGKKEIVPSGPLYRECTVEAGKVRVRFDHVGGGLMVGAKAGAEPVQEVKDGVLKQFAIAGADKAWHWAEAVIDGDSVVVSSPEVATPVAVRYAFSATPTGANLYNREGLPASPFRTDDW